MTQNRIFLVAVAAAALAAAACDQHEVTRSRKLGGQVVSAQTLNDGYEAYMLYCYACHGPNGDGKGPASKGLRPPPRNFKQGIFKFAGVQGGQLPSDEDLDRIIRNGLKGTAMLAWDITPEERHDIIQYIKTFRQDYDPKKMKDALDKRQWSVWDYPSKKVQQAEFVAATPDPFGPARHEEAAAIGKKVYHIVAQCQGCHPSFLTTEEYQTLSLPGVNPGDPVRRPPAPRDDAYNPQGKDSVEFKVRLLPPNFMLNPVRSVRPLSCQGVLDHCEEGHTLDDFYRVVYNGIPGAAMPPWSSLKPEELWSLAHYLESLYELRGTDKGREFRELLLSQPPYVAPPPVAPGPDDSPGGGRPAPPAPRGAAPEAPAPAAPAEPAPAAAPEPAPAAAPPAAGDAPSK